MINIGILSYNVISGYSNEESNLINHRFNFFKSNGIILSIIDEKQFDLGKKTFLKYKTQCGDFKIVDDIYKPDIIRLRSSVNVSWNIAIFISNYKLFPSLPVYLIANDKWLTYKFLSEFQPITYTVEDLDKSNSLLDKFEGDEIVIKPRNGYGGKGVEKVTKKHLLKTINKYIGNGYIVQELCDLSRGYDGLSNTNHDFRVVVIGGEITYCTLRTNANDFRVNVSLGGNSEYIENVKIPKDLLIVIEKCLLKLGSSNIGLVSLDFGYDSKKGEWMLIELNYSPGFTQNEYPKKADLIELAYLNYIRHFKDTVMQNVN